MTDQKKPKRCLEGTVITTPADLVDFYQLGDFECQFQGGKYLPRVTVCNTVAKRDQLARKVGLGNHLVVRLLGQPIPRDTERFRYLSPEPWPVMPPGLTFPSPEEMVKQSLDRMVEMHRRGIDGN